MKKVVLSLLAVVATLGLQAQTKYSHYYKDLPCAVEQVQEIVIPDYSVTLTDFGAVGDGKTDCSEAFAQALKHLKKQGGATPPSRPTAEERKDSARVARAILRRLRRAVLFLQPCRLRRLSLFCLMRLCEQAHNALSQKIVRFALGCKKLR